MSKAILISKMTKQDTPPAVFFSSLATYGLQPVGSAGGLSGFSVVKVISYLAEEWCFFGRLRGGLLKAMGVVRCRTR